MAKYFRFFPKTFYTSDVDSDGLDSVTNIIARFAFANNLKDNTNMFYPYDVQDTDTPEIIAHKMYGSSERHWIILSLNQIVDPQWDWPLSHDNFIQYVNNKYTANANTAAGETGVQYALNESNIHAYFKVITRTVTAGASNRESRSRTVQVEKIEIDATTFASLTLGTTFDSTLKDGTAVKEVVSSSTESFYTYEFNQNEAKRSIKILKPEFVPELDREFKRIFTR